MCTAVDVKKEKKRAYDAEHSCIGRQWVTEYLEKMDVSTEQCCVFKFCARLKKTSSETTILLKEAFKMIWQWHKAFVDGWGSTEFELQGSASWTVVKTTNINTITAVMEEDWHLIFQAFTESLHTPCDTKSEDNESVMDDE